MSKTNIPADTFDTELLTAGNVRNALKGAEATKTDSYMVAPSKLREIPGFNVRVETPDYLTHVAGTKESIKANGFDPTKPISGFVGKDGDEDVIYVTDGYTRRRAVLEAISEGFEIAAVPVTLQPAGTSVEDLMVGLVTANSGRPLSVYEKAIVAKRLQGYGWEPQKIADKLTITTRYLDDLMVLIAAPSKVRNAVIKGQISPAEAVKALRKDGAKAADVVEGAVKEAAARGKTKATPKDVKAAKKKGAGKDVPAGETKAEGFGKRKSGVAWSATTRGGMVHQTGTYFFKQGDVLPIDDIRPVRLFHDGDWWNFVDPATKEHVLIEDSIEIEVTIRMVAPAEEAAKDPAKTEGEDDTFALPGSQKPQDGQEGQEGTDEAPAPETPADDEL